MKPLDFQPPCRGTRTRRSEEQPSRGDTWNGTMPSRSATANGSRTPRSWCHPRRPATRERTPREATSAHLSTNGSNATRKAFGRFGSSCWSIVSNEFVPTSM